MNDSDKSTMNKKLVKYCTYRHLETAVLETEYMVGTVLCVYIYIHHQDEERKHSSFLQSFSFVLSLWQFAFNDVFISHHPLAASCAKQTIFANSLTMPIQSQ